MFRPMICGNNYSWFQDLSNTDKDTQDRRREWLVDFSAGKT